MRVSGSRQASGIAGLAPQVLGRAGGPSSLSLLSLLSPGPACSQTILCTTAGDRRQAGWPENTPSSGPSALAQPVWPYTLCSPDCEAFWFLCVTVDTLTVLSWRWFGERGVAGGGVSGWNWEGVWTGCPQGRSATWQACAFLAPSGQKGPCGARSRGPATPGSW